MTKEKDKRNKTKEIRQKKKTKEKDKRNKTKEIRQKNKTKEIRQKI